MKYYIVTYLILGLKRILDVSFNKKPSTLEVYQHTKLSFYKLVWLLQYKNLKRLLEII